MPTYTRSFDFREDLEDFRSKLSEQAADGGGDFPGTGRRRGDHGAARLARRRNTARLAFWVADAPHHNDRAAAMAGRCATRQLDIHIYPVASSGIDEFTELGMRSAAVLPAAGTCS
jgi:hypothetical protein